jgi:hypothetical protein
MQHLECMPVIVIWALKATDLARPVKTTASTRMSVPTTRAKTAGGAPIQHSIGNQKVCLLLH